MKTKITAAILFITAIGSHAFAQDSFKAESPKLYSVPETIVKVFSRTETFFGNAFNNSGKDAKSNLVIPNSSAENYISLTETFFGADFKYPAEGAKINSIVPYSPAANYNFRNGDIINSIGNIVIDSEENYRLAMQSYKPGEVVTVSYSRKGIHKITKVKLDKIIVYREDSVK